MESIGHRDRGRRHPPGVRGRGNEDARAIICANGVGVSTFFWDYMGRHFSGDNHFLVWDYRGHGASGQPRTPEAITMASMADDMARVLDANKVDRAMMLGHSMGCQVILEFCRLFPDRVLALVPILGSYGRAADTFLDPRVGRAIFKAAYEVGTKIPEVVNTFARLTLRSRAAWPFARRTGLVHRDMAKREDMEPYLEHLSRMDMRIFVELVRAAQDHDAGPSWVRYGVRSWSSPVSAISSRPVTSPWRWPNASRTRSSLEIPRGSHAALIEQPELINLRIEKFIRERVVPYEAKLEAEKSVKAS